MTDLHFTYCDTHLWWGIHQPTNVLSNLVFILLAIWVWQQPSARWHRFGLLAIAAGSVVWHHTALSWALWLDIGTIALWAFLFAVDTARVTQRPAWIFLLSAAGALMVSAAAGRLLAGPLPLLSGAFIPFAALLLSGALSSRLRPPVRRTFLFSLAMILLAMVMREIDLLGCSEGAIGTHWLWHTAAGLSLLAPIRFLIDLDQGEKRV